MNIDLGTTNDVVFYDHNGMYYHDNIVIERLRRYHYRMDIDIEEYYNNRIKYQNHSISHDVGLHIEGNSSKLPSNTRRDYRHIRNNEFNRKWNMTQKHRREKGRY